MILHIKNMVCDRCIMAVKQELDRLGIAYGSVLLGEVSTEDISQEKKRQLADNLQSIGFELLDDQKARIVERIKNVIISLVHRSEEPSPMKLSALLQEQLGMDYHYLTTLFSAVEGITIERFAILQRIEKVKELLKYGELTLGEIADKLGYSSSQHLSQQFRKVTGMTPSAFRDLKENTRRPLDKVKRS